MILMSAVDEHRLSPDERRLAERVREACLRAARDTYEEAAIQSLCAEEAQECALGAIETLDLEAVAREMKQE